MLIKPSATVKMITAQLLKWTTAHANNVCEGTYEVPRSMQELISTAFISRKRKWYPVILIINRSSGGGEQSREQKPEHPPQLPFKKEEKENRRLISIHITLCRTTRPPIDGGFNSAE